LTEKTVNSLPLKIATAPVNWNNNDLPGWRAIVPFPDILNRMLDAGYTATEYDEKFGLDPDVVLPEVNSRAMRLCGSYQWLDLLNPAVFESQIPAFTARLQLLHELQCDSVIIADSLRPERIAIAGNVPEDGSASLPLDGYRQIAESARCAAAIAGKFGIATHYHNHVGTWIETPTEVDHLLQSLRDADVDLCFDTGHYAYGGGNAAAFIETHVREIGYLHLKDVDSSKLQAARSNRWSFLDALREIVFSPLGEGNAGIERILDVLSMNGFQGWVVIEQDTCAGDQTEVARRNLDVVKRTLAERTKR
jgi:inosose dehydratase